MVLIDCMFVNNGGAKVLLDYLVKCFSVKYENIYFLFDERCQNEYGFIKNKIFIKNNLYQRYIFFYKNRNKFNIVFSFGNVPVFFGKSFNKKIVYFHQKIFLLKKLSILFYIKSKIIFFLRKNVDFWIVQNQDMRNSLVRKFNIEENKVKIIPFYPSFMEVKLVNTNQKVKNTFIYVSSGAEYKNHLRLIDAFCASYDKAKKGILYLTVDKEFGELCEIINNKSKLGYPIINLGYLSRDNLFEYYSKSEFCIYPSLAESFGLGLIEGIECKCSVIASDMDYVHNICIPTATFNPYSVTDISQRIDDALNEKKVLKPTVQLCFNQIEVLEKLLFSE